MRTPRWSSLCDVLWPVLPMPHRRSRSLLAPLDNISYHSYVWLIHRFILDFDPLSYLHNPPTTPTTPITHHPPPPPHHTTPTTYLCIQPHFQGLVWSIIRFGHGATSLVAIRGGFNTLFCTVLSLISFSLLSPSILQAKDTFPQYSIYVSRLANAIEQVKFYDHEKAGFSSFLQSV
jgi:hypothetical protein